MNEHETEDIQLVEEVLQRDGGCCRVCNSPVDVVVHRRTGGDGPVLADDFTALCKSCHDLYHHAAEVLPPVGYERV